MYQIPLSPYHKIFYNEWKINPNRTDYNIVFDQSLSKNLNVNQLTDALKRFVSEHLLLNSKISHLIDGNIIWVYDTSVSLLEVFTKDQSVSKYVNKPFDLESDKLYRFAIFDEDECYRLILIFHHIVIDGASGNYVIDKISKYYNDNEYVLESSIDGQFIEISKKIDGITLKVNDSNNLDFLSYIKALSLIKPMDLGFLKPNHENFKMDGVSEINFQLIIPERYNFLTNKYELSIYAYSKIIFLILMHKYTKINDLVTSYPIMIREQTNFIYGAGINILFSLLHLNSSTKLIEIIKQILEENKQTSSYKYCPIYQTISTGINPHHLDTAFIQTNLKDIPFDFDNIEVKNINNDFNIDLNSNLMFEQKIKNQQLKIRVRYKDFHIDKNKIEEFISNYKKLFFMILKDLENGRTDLAIDNYNLISNYNYYQNVDDWASSYNIQNQKKTLNDFISQQVKLSTNDSGVLYQNHLISYSALHEKSNKLARLLIKEYDIEIGDFIMVNLECNESFIIAILAVLKTGGIFIPINPSSSTERIKYILEDSYTKLIISDSKNQLQKTIAESANKEVMICNIKSILTAKNLENFSSENLDTKIGSESPVFVIYSNIDNGKASCVMISHNMLINKIELMNSEMQIYNNDKLWMCENDYFESTIWFMFWAISNGATIILSSKSLANNNLLSFFCESRATVLYLNLDALEAFDESVRVGANSKVNRIRAIYYNQESLSASQYTDISKSFGDGVLNTLYTPTYNSIDLLNVINSENNYYSQFSLLPESFDRNTLSSDIEDAYPASHLQVGMLLASELSDTGAYHNVIVKTINTKFDATKFITIWDNIINRQELLRAKFRLDNDGWICLIENSVTKFYEIYRKSSLSKIINLEKIQDFDFNKPGLFKLIINLRRNDFDFIFSFHHAIADGNSANILMNQFISAYVFDKNLGLKTSAFYGEFVKKELESIDSLSNNKFWSYYLAETDAADKIKWNFKDTKSTDDLETLTLSLTKDDIERIHEVSKRNVIGIDNIFLYAYIKTLSQFLNQEIVTIGLNVDNNIQNEDNNFLLGLFSNIIPFQFDMKNVRNNHHGILSAFAQKVKLYKYKEFPYSKIKEIIQKDVFQFAFNYVNFESYDLGYQRSNIPFILNIYNVIDEFSINFVAHDDVIDKDYLDYFAQYYIFHLRDIINNPENNKLDLIPEDYKKIVYDWNDTDKDFPREKTIPQLFEEQVEKTPDNIAVVYESVKLTYRELNNRSNILATVLIEKYGVRIEDLVALYLNRSEYMIIAILAVLKSGGAYVPIATDYPPDRTNYILNDTNTKIVLTNEIFYDKLVSLKYSNLSDKDNTNTSYNICIVENINIKSTDMFALMNPLIGLKSNNLAYVIYTSGTTGNPKGVMVKHINIANFIHDENFICKSHKPLNSILIAPYFFDVSIFDIWSTFLYGHSLYIINENSIKDIKLFKSFLKHYKINKLYLSANLLKIHLDTLIKFKNQFLYILTGVEPLENEILETLITNKVKLINGYGPTETTVCATAYEFSNHKIPLSYNVPIGKPISNTKIFILGKHLNLLPVGCVGELYITGLGITKGYLKEPTLTRDKFIEGLNIYGFDPSVKNFTIYKTGDLVRYIPNGNIEYIRRVDCQIKINGIRVDLHEIEVAIKLYAKIKHAIVRIIKYNDLSNILSGYYISDDIVDFNELSEFLRTKLPTYMIPVTFIRINEIPLTLNGKVNVDQLPLPSFNELNFTLPRNNLELSICTAFENVLNRLPNSISIYDDFFKCGGNSLLAIKLSYELQKKKLLVKINDIFNLKTPEQIVKSVICSNNNLINLIITKYKTEPLLPNKKLDLHYNKVKDYSFTISKKDNKVILLTGATGHLGSYILYSLLIETNYNIIILSRSFEYQDFKSRVYDKFEYYHNLSLDIFNDRVIIIKSNIQEEDLGIDYNDCETISKSINSIIHCAALVKHYGTFNDFYNANVKSTVNLLNFALKNKIDDFHYISTISVLDGYLSNKEYTHFSEKDCLSTFGINENLYIQTKRSSEKYVQLYRKYGLHTNIYRVGNLCLNSNMQRLQQNITENSFFIIFKFLVNFKLICNEIAKVNVSTVNDTALGIIKIFEQKHLTNQTFHVYNPVQYDLNEVFKEYLDNKIKMVSLETFLSEVFNNTMDNNKMLFLLHQGWLNFSENKNTNVTIHQEKTSTILSTLGFNWKDIKPKFFEEILLKASEL